MIKKAMALFMAALLAVAACACTNTPEESSSSSSEAPSSTVSSVPQTLTFDGIDFSFTIPARWSKENYTVKVTKDAVMDGQEVEYNKVDFLFKGNADLPLLSLWAAPKAWWDDQISVGAALPTLLQEQGDIVYLAVLPENPTVPDEEQELYQSMAISADEVKDGFTVTASPSSSKTESSYMEGILEDGTINTITIKTDDGKELFFDKEGAEVNAPDGLIIGDRLRVYYSGSIEGTDTSGVVVSKVEKVSQ